MEKCVVENYEVHQGTMAILSAIDPSYYSVVIEKDREIYVKETPLQLIKSACLEGGATYEGRRTAVMHQTGTRQKVPIPIHPLEEIYAFPTHSAKQFDCSWIFYKHVKKITTSPRNRSHSIITFQNNYELTINVSAYILVKQMHRTAYCFIRFSNRFLDPNRLG